MTTARIDNASSTIRRTAAALSLVFFVVLLPACAPPTGPAPKGDIPSTSDLLARLDYLGSEFDSLKGFARITYNLDGAKQSADHVVLVEHPDKLRLETLGLFGSPVMLAATDGMRSVALFPGEAQAYVGPAGGGFLQKVTRLPLTPKMVVSIVLRRPDILDWRGIEVSDAGGGRSRLTLRDGRLSQAIEFDERRRIVRVAYYAGDLLVSAIRYDRYRDDFPRMASIELPASGLKITLDYESIETNPHLDSALFRLVPSDAYQVNPFPER